MSAAVTNIAGGDEIERPYRAWRYAKAQWELADNAPDKPDGLSIEEADEFCDVEHNALLAFMLHPAPDAIQLARKLSVFRAEQGWMFTQAPMIVEQLHSDARMLAYPRTEPLRNLAKSPRAG
jgi:hypothetical protein